MGKPKILLLLPGLLRSVSCIIDYPFPCHSNPICNTFNFKIRILPSSSSKFKDHVVTASSSSHLSPMPTTHFSISSCGCSWIQENSMVHNSAKSNGTPKKKYSALPTTKTVDVSSISDLFEFICSGPLVEKIGITPERVGQSIDKWLLYGSQLCRLFQLNELKLTIPQKARLYHYYIPVFIWCEDQIALHDSKFKDGDDVPPLVIGFSAPQGCGKTTLVFALDYLFKTTKSNDQGTLGDAYPTISPRDGGDIEYCGFDTMKLKILYMFVVGFYTYSIFALVFLETRRSGFGVSMSHHIVTLILIILSYIYRFSRPGSVILALHDTSDLFLEVGKMSKYGEAKSITAFSFVLFALSWVILRLIYYLFWILWSTSYQIIMTVDKEKQHSLSPMTSAIISYDIAFTYESLCIISHSTVSKLHDGGVKNRSILLN